MISETKFSNLPWDWKYSIIFSSYFSWALRPQIEEWLKSLGYKWGIDYTILQEFEDPNSDNITVLTKVFCSDQSLITLLSLRWNGSLL